MSEEKPIKRVYFRIGHVANALGTSQSLIRFWMDHLDIKAHRNVKGNRMFSEANIDLLIRVYYLVKIEERSLQSVKEIIHPETASKRKSFEDIHSECWTKLRENEN